MRIELCNNIHLFEKKNQFNTIFGFIPYILNVCILNCNMWREKKK